MQANDLIKDKRKSLCIQAHEVAAFAEISSASYRDIEDDIAEVWNVATLATVRRICTYLSLDIIAIYNCFIDPKVLDVEIGVSVDMSREVLIRTRRESMNLSREQLGEIIGFETIAIDRMESDFNFLEDWSGELIAALAKSLGIPFTDLLNR